MRFAAAAVALAGAALADYPAEYPTTYDPPVYPVETSTDSPVYPTAYPTSYDPAYPTYDPTSVYSSEAAEYTTSVVYTTKCYTHSDEYTSYVVTSTEAAYTTVCPVEVEYPTYSTVTYEAEHTYEAEATYPASSPCPESEAATYEATYATYAPACPTYSVKTIHTSVATVIYETIQIPCPTIKAVPSAYPTTSYNTTKPYPVVTAGAANVAVSGLLAAAVGLAALAFA